MAPRTIIVLATLDTKGREAQYLRECIEAEHGVDLAGDALERHDGLTGLARATELELAAIPGVGAVKGGQIVAAFELGRRLLDRMTQDMLDIATIESHARLEGRNMVMILTPKQR